MFVHLEVLVNGMVVFSYLDGSQVRPPGLELSQPSFGSRTQAFFKVGVGVRFPWQLKPGPKFSEIGIGARAPCKSLHCTDKWQVNVYKADTCRAFHVQQKGRFELKVV